MKFKHLNSLILFTYVVLVLISCKKDKNTNPDASSADSCLVVSMIDSTSFGLQILYENKKPARVNLLNKGDSNNWEIDPWLHLRYNSSEQLSDYVVQVRSNSFEFDRIQYNGTGRIREVWSYDSIQGETPIQYGTAIPSYDANNKIRRIDYIEDEDTIFYLNATYDPRGHLSEVIGYFPKPSGGYFPQFKDVFFSDDRPQNTYLFATYFGRFEGLYLLFNQKGQGQLGGYIEFTYDDFYDKWVKKREFIISNSYENNRLHRSVIGDENYYYTYDCN